VRRRIKGKRIGRLTGTSSKPATRGMCLERSFRPSQPLLPSKSYDTSSAISNATSNRARWGNPPTTARLAEGRDISTHAAMRFTWRATAAAAGEEHPRAQGLARTSAYNDANSDRGALSLPCNDETPAAAAGHLHAHAVARVTVFGARPKETKGETPWGEEYGRRRRARGCAFTESWIG